MTVSNQQVERILLDVLEPDTQKVKKAEAQIKIILKNVACVHILMNQIQRSQQEGVRQLAAVLLRKKIASYWKKLGEELQHQLKNALLQSMIHESHKPVQMAVAGVVAVVAGQTVPNGQWNDLLEFLLQCSQQADARFRELAMRLFRVLADDISEHMVTHFDTLFAIFVNGLTDSQSLVVREEALRAIKALLFSCEEESQLQKFASIVPTICLVIEKSIECDHESAAACGFEFLDEFIEFPFVDSTCLGALVQFASNVMLLDSVSLDIRNCACDLIANIVKSQPGKLIQLGLVQNILNSCIHMIANGCCEEVEDDDGEDELEHCIELLDEAVLSFPNDLVYQPCLDAVVGFAQSPKKNHRSAAQVVLLIIAEGCADSIREKVSSLIELVLVGIQDSEKSVRIHACSGMKELVTHVQPEIFEHRHQILAQVIARLDDPNESVEVKQELMGTLDALCTHLPQDMLSRYLEEIMKRLDQFVRVQDKTLQLGALEAIGSVAVNAREQFLPFFSHFIGLIKAFMRMEGKDDWALRASATRVAGNLAIGIGREHYSAHFTEIIALSMEGLKLDCCEIRESAYFLYSYFAEVFGQDCMAFVPQIIGRVFETLTSDEAIVIDYVDEHNEAFGDIGSLDVEDEDEEIENYDLKNLKCSVLNAYIEEQQAALQALSDFFGHIGAGFLPYLEDTLSALDKLHDSAAASIRMSVWLCCSQILESALRILPFTGWTQGVLEPLPRDTDTLVQKIFILLTSSFAEEDEKGIASTAIDVMSRAIKWFGPAVLPYSQYKSILMKILSGTSLCQRIPAEAASATDEEIDDLLDSATNLISAVAHVMGPAFTEDFREISVPMMQAIQNSTHAGVITSILGGFGEALSELGPNVIQFADPLFPVIFAALGHPSFTVQQCGAYCAGAMFRSANSDALQAYYQTTLAKLQPLLSIPSKASSDMLSAKDNAVSAISKMMCADPRGLPLDHMIPIFLQNLPLQVDAVENKFVYPNLMFLAVECSQTCAPHIQEIVLKLATALASDDVDEKTKASISQFMKTIVQQHTNQFKPIIEGLPSDLASTLVQSIQ